MTQYKSFLVLFIPSVRGHFELPDDAAYISLYCHLLLISQIVGPKIKNVKNRQENYEKCSNFV
jgi:hypothetical protein